MSLLFGGGGSMKPQFNGLQTQTSMSSLPIPICWGQNRVAPNIIWQGDFQSHKHKQGKGGGKGGTYYTYSASFQFGLCWGPIETNGIVTVWKDQSKVVDPNTASPSVLGKTGGNVATVPAYNFFRGTTPQAPWGYLVTAHPTEALGYPGIVHVDVVNYDLGQSNSVGQHSFEIKALRWDTALGGGASAKDADPALVIEDFLSNDSFGVGFDMTVLSNMYSTGAATTTGDSAFQTYCRAMGFGLSPCLVSQARAGETLERWAMLCNTAVVYNGYTLKFHPYGPDTVTGNGVTYIPDFPVRYTLTDADFISDKNSDPVKFNRVDPADGFNTLSMIIANRANDYNELPVPWKDQGLVDQFGVRKDNNIEAKEITEISMAQKVVALIGQRRAYVRNTFEFKLPVKYCLLEPMDVVEIVDVALGTFYVLLKEVTENDDDEIECVAEEYNASVSVAGANSAQPTANTPKNTLDIPESVNAPIIFEPPSSLTGGKAQIWAAVSGGNGTTFDPNWGGAYVYISTDNIQYIQVGQVESAARMGKLSSNLATYGGTNPDTLHTLAVNLTMSGGELDTEASAQDAAAGSNLCYVDGEFISFELPTLTSTYNYNLTNLWRGLFGSTIATHLSNSQFARLDDAIFKYDLPEDYIGKTLYLKFQSYNLFELSAEDLSTCTAYTITPEGKGYGTGTGGVPATPATPVATPSGAVIGLSWAANSVNDNLTGYKVYRASGTGSAFGSASLIATVPSAATTYADGAIAPGAGYTYFIVATNALGDSSPSTGANATAAATGTGQPFGFAFSWPSPVADKGIAWFDSPVGWTIPASLTDSQGNLTDAPSQTAVAPSATTDFDIQSPPGTSIGTMRFASGATTATLIKASATAIPLGQPVVIVAPSNLNGMQGLVYGSIKGTR